MKFPPVDAMQSHPDLGDSCARLRQHTQSLYVPCARGCGRDLGRRQFVRMAGLSAAALGAAMSWPRHLFANAQACVSPNPIPGGFVFDSTLYHLLLPGFPPLGSPDPAANDPSSITDFNGHVGLAYVVGTGTHTNKTSGVVRQLPFGVDLRFMTGEYRGVDGRMYHGAFALI